ncbi:MAG: hypothetical protein GY909_14010 [Oligoflexia bacterium]|nr:hypothetical protein [Oligoflexia bacterium]
MKSLLAILALAISISSFSGEILCTELGGDQVSLPYNFEGENTGIQSVDIYDDCYYQEELVNQTLGDEVMAQLNEKLDSRKFMILCLSHAAAYSSLTFVFENQKGELDSKNGVILVDDLSIELRESANCQKQ